MANNAPDHPSDTAQEPVPSTPQEPVAASVPSAPTHRGPAAPEQGREAPSGERRAKAPRPQAVLEVLGKTRVTPHLMRILLGGPGIADLADNDATDKYVKLLLPDPSSGLTPPYDLDRLRAESPELLPTVRTYTVRSWDRGTGRIAVDFVLHGEGELEGVAARWADGAIPGDLVAMRGAGGNYAPSPEASFHLLLGDHSALPAIASALEAMTAEARGLVLIQLDHAEDRLHLSAPDGVEIRYLLGDREGLLEAVTALDLVGSEGLQIFAHAERGLVKQIRRALVVERGIPKDQISISAYWALGRVEDQFQAEKREPIGKIDA